MEVSEVLIVRIKTHLELRYDTNRLLIHSVCEEQFQLMSRFQEKLALPMNYKNLYLKPTQVG